MTETPERCLNCGNDSPCSCSEPMPAASKIRWPQATTEVFVTTDAEGRWIADCQAGVYDEDMPVQPEDPAPDPTINLLKDRLLRAQLDLAQGQSMKHLLHPSEVKSEPDYDRAIGILIRRQRASTSLLQREMGIGYNAAARLMERAEADGFVTKPNEVGKRHVVIRPLHSPIQQATS